MTPELSSNNIAANQPIRAGGSLAKRLLFTAVIVALAFCAPLTAGFRYQMLPFALWEFSAHPIQAGTVRSNGQMRPVYGGEVVNCGFFSLRKEVVVNWGNQVVQDR